MLRRDKIVTSETKRFTTFLFSNFKKSVKIVHYTEMKFGDNGNYQYGNIVDQLINQSVDESDFK